MKASEVSKLTGISKRALHHYDEIGLLTPSRNQENEYREYSNDDIDRLQEILFFKECGLSLKNIKDILDSESYDRLKTLEYQRKKLELEKKRIDKMLRTLDNTIKSEKGEIKMSNKDKFECFKEDLIKENEEKYGEEIREKYGKEEIDASNAKMMNLSEGDYNAMQSLASEINTKLESAVKSKLSPSSKEGKEIAEMHKKWLSYTWSTYSKEAHNGLAEMYVADERFTAYYDKNITGCAQFLRDAIVENNK